MFLIVHQSFYKIIKLVVQVSRANWPIAKIPTLHPNLSESIQINPTQRTMNSTIYYSNATKIAISKRHNKSYINTRAHWGKKLCGVARTNGVISVSEKSLIWQTLIWKAASKITPATNHKPLRLGINSGSGKNKYLKEQTIEFFKYLGKSTI